MCVIVVCEKRLPTLDELELFEDANPHGAGIAWMEGERIRWVKGIDAGAIDRMRPYLETRLPVVMHFRITSVGKTCTPLCHPFPTGSPLPTELAGGLDDEVLFHNGTWTRWWDELVDRIDEDPWKWKHVLRGEWSDTRFMAALLGQHPEYLDVAGTGLEKQAILIFNKKEIALYGNWEEWKDFSVSNTHFIRPVYKYTPPKYALSQPYGADDDWGWGDSWAKAFEEQDKKEAAALEEGPPASRHGDVIYDEGICWIYDADVEEWCDFNTGEFKHEKVY